MHQWSAKRQVLSYGLQHKLELIIAERTEEFVKQKERAEEIVTNILPKDTAEEIKSTGRATRKKYKMVTVLFSDVQGFTKIAEHMNPDVLLDELETNQKIEFDINHNKISDAAGNSLDSVQTISLETLSGREFTGLSGNIDIPEFSDNCVVVINNIDIKNLSYSSKVNDNNEFAFERILPGKYTILTFLDNDSSGIYNYGKVVPFELSEKFYKYPDTLNLRARWPVGDVLISK